MSSASALRSADRSISDSASANVSGTVKPSIEVESYDRQPDCQLQRSLLDSKRRDTDYHRHNYGYEYGYYPSRTYSWEVEAERQDQGTPESDFLSEVSGQFDDAEEYAYESATEHINNTTENDSHSIKRRRSNDWPKRTVENLNNSDRRTTPSRQRWPFHYYARHTTGSPRSRSPRLAARAGRRSRFVEGHMADTVSEKPPSIFFPDEARAKEENAAAAAGGKNPNRNTGIFRFGKAIASAFNPFGSWGSVSDVWRRSQVQEQNQEKQVQPGADDRLRQAQLAYEELKKAGFQGTNKGSYMQNLQGGAGAGTGAGAGGLSSIPDETWKAIQEKMEYGSGSTPATGSGAGHSRQSSGQTPSNRNSMSGSSLRPSFADLNIRKAKSSLTVRKQATGADTPGQEVRHQKSRKDMQREAKLLKRVSNLEDKLSKVRRELRELSGDCEEQVVARSSLNEERPYQRKFVPGALPSLPSERLLHENELGSESEPLALLSPTPKDTLRVPEVEHEGQPQSQIRVSKRNSQTFKHRARSSSRKRKSPDPESRKKSESDPHELPPLPIFDSQGQEEPDSQPTTALVPEGFPFPLSEPAEAETEAPIAKTTPSRKPKLPKTARGDSPGSVERKQKQRRSPSAENAGEERASSASRPLRSTTRNRSATPILRQKRGRGDLRSTTSPGHGEEDKENYHGGGDDQEMGLIKPDMQDEQAVPTAISPSPSPSTPSRRKVRYEYIPPVPPLPKDLAATAAKVDRRLAREMGKRRAQMEKDGKPAEKFQWPEDIF